MHACAYLKLADILLDEEDLPKVKLKASADLEQLSENLLKFSLTEWK